jgi:hypothetical protein
MAHQHAKEGATGMKRYFYTDPLAAAWMRKHFDMTILVAASTKTLGSKGVAFCFVENLAQDFDYRNCNVHELAEKGTKFIVCSTSHHLLEPQVGDLCMCRVHLDDPASEVAPFTIHVPHTKHDVVSIIQRNGIPFIWPESEEA